jgi:predicted secreted hydrolase
MQKKQHIIFPQDGGEHWNAAEEWWYFNSHVITSNNTRLSLFVSFLRERIMLMINDLTKGRSLRSVEIPGRLMHTSTSKMDLNFGRNRWRDTSNQPLKQQLHLESDGIVIDLVMKSRKPPLPINDAGRIRFGLLGNSWYYSLTRLEVEGSLEIDGRRESVKGSGWFDRQWGSWEYGGMGGWRWFSLQLDGDTEILFMKIMHPVTGQPLDKILHIIPPDSKVRIVEQFGLKPLRTWASSRTGITYQMGWRLNTDSLSIKVKPCLEDQEIRPGFWEGPCLVEGTMDGRDVTGVGFVEQHEIQPYASTYLKFITLSSAIPRHVIRTAFGHKRENAFGSISRLWNLSVARMSTRGSTNVHE